jgi:NDP-sugar pyrophosphorylase family protein
MAAEIRQDRRLSLVDPSCVLKPGVEIVNSVLGPNCILEERVRIGDSVIWAGTALGRTR